MPDPDATCAAEAAPISDAEREELLARLDPLRESIDAAEAELERLREARAAVYLEIRESAPGLPLSQLASRAGVSVPAVIQQIEKATARRAAAADQPEAAAG